MLVQMYAVPRRFGYLSSSTGVSFPTSKCRVSSAVGTPCPASYHLPHEYQCRTSDGTRAFRLKARTPY